MMSAGSAVSESSTAPSTDCSASRFCGGAIGPSGTRSGAAWPLLMRSGMLTSRESRLRVGPNIRSCRKLRRVCAGLLRRRDCQPESALLLLDDHRLDGRRDAVLDLDHDHPG